MDKPLGIFAGAGVSTAQPAGLPLGDEFHGLLLTGCQDAARRYAPRAVSDDGLRLLLTAGRRNILGCIEDCLPAGTTAGVLDCMRVFAPTEAHLLCAVHAARGALLITTNFDNGIELAYALLTGATALNSQAPAVYHEALGRWRRQMPDAAPLHVISTPAQLAWHEGVASRPTLVKLRGSVDRGTDSTVTGLRPAMEDMESTRLDEDRFAALSAVASCDHLVVTGHSGRDLDCFESLRMVLRPERFTWAVPEMDTAVAGRITAIDPGQPRRGTAESELRSLLPKVPAWPRTGWQGGRFDARFRAWWAELPPAATAEAYAWMLADAGRFAEPIAILRGLLRSSDGVRLRLRLADVLIRRGRPEDHAEAERICVGVLGDTRPYPRFDVETRLAQARPGLTPAALLGLLETVTARLAGDAGSTQSRSAIRCVTILTRLIRERHDGPVPDPVLLTVRRSLELARAQAGRLGTGTRQSDLDLEVVAVAGLSALYGGPPLPPDAVDRLAAVERAYAHRGDAVGGLRAAGVRALGRLADGDPAGAEQAAAALLAAGAGHEYAHLAVQVAAGVRRLISAAPLASKIAR